VIILLRSLAFNALFYLNTLLFLIAALPTFFMPYRAIVEVAKSWGRVNLVLLRVVAGIKCEVRGLEKLPPGPLIVASKHQSAWETFALLPLLGLAWPFRAVDPAGERMRATATAVERALRRPGGGLLRYKGDVYAGGNPWVLGTLWLGLYRRGVGDVAGHARALAYAREVATPLGLLPEQVTEDGAPAWVVPLAWSHAMLLLAARPELSLHPRS